MRGSRYSDDQRRKAAIGYVLTGSAKQAAAMAGIPERTARYWCQPDGAPQPPSFADLCRAERVRLYRARARLAMKTTKRIEDRLERGEFSFRDQLRLLRS